MRLHRGRIARAGKRRHAHRGAQERIKGWRASFEHLEGRVLLHGGTGLDHHLHDGQFEYHAFEVSEQILNADFTDPGSQSLLAALHPLTSIPALNSNPGAPATVYLDFDGHFESSWGEFSNISTPVFDQDNDTNSFSDGELATITEIWQRVAEDYASFNVNVTTINPGSFANGDALLVSIGGNGGWIGPYGGVAYVNSFTNSIPNTVYVFSDNLANGFAKYVADASSHEAGHAFGLEHQSKYDTQGNLLLEYHTGDGVLAPIMGNSYSTPQSVWYYGTSTSPSTFQDDMAVISRTANGFGYRADDHGDTIGTASALSVAGGILSGAGIIATTSDADYFSFVTGSGAISVTADVAPFGPNLDVHLELRTTGGALLASANPTPDLSATISTNLSGGTYVLVVRSAGAYGEVGQYSINGSVTAGVFAGGLFRGGMWHLDQDGLGGVAEQSLAFGISGDTPVVGDWDADGVDELGIFRGGHWYFDLDGAGGAGESSIHFGIGSDVPVVGDFNGDGTDDVGVFRNGAWYLDAAGNDGIADTSFFFGLGSDVPVVGDWDGDGVDNVGVFRAGKWFFDLDGSGGAAEGMRFFGVGGDLPVVGDWSDDGTDDVAVFRAGSWFLDTDGAGGMAEMHVPFGLPGDQPVSGQWIAPPSAPPASSSALASTTLIGPAAGPRGAPAAAIAGFPAAGAARTELADRDVESLAPQEDAQASFDLPEYVAPSTSLPATASLVGHASAGAQLHHFDGSDSVTPNDQAIADIVPQLDDLLAAALA